MSKLILSLDGGGIRGVAITQFLSMVEQQLQQNHDKSIRDCVDLYAGTSTGSIIALALATTDMTLAQIDELYNYENGQRIFTEHKGLLDIDGINAPKYEASGKTSLLQENFNQAKIGDVPEGKHVLAVSYDIEKRKPVIIKSTKPDYLELLSSEAADATSAAPTFFPTKGLESPDTSEESWLIDGGVIANNPTMCAIAEARNVWPHYSLSDMRVLSIGTGFLTRKINGASSRKWGALQWMTEGKLMEVLSDERIVSYQSLTIMDRGNYIRVNAKLKPQPGLPNPPDDAMDDLTKSNINRLRELGKFWFSEYGEAVVQLLLNTYQGPSLDRIDPKTGHPIA
ncbi:patatin [Shewanella psychropiezotolerans]|uniref:Patatin n=2 Tax=Shewanella TaxID=22 RepID=A0A1S6HW88_9GAMM|nr:MULTISPECIES: patatin-like phospholipase family protein [Shewanella]AQS39840.1 patatin [Shewanella psychrophila]MPY23058.1 patatin [Shewanella sp. YLB-07]QDO82717.1 patatin [Shewanella psychropiezotolerans]